jgi:hypothetical protein
MATTIDIPCPKCGHLVMANYLEVGLHELLFLKFMRSSFRVECTCGLRKTYYLVSAEKLARMYEPPAVTTENENEA